jgi:hypothetical protein
MLCPGDALPAIGTGRIKVIIFVLALTAGILAAKILKTAFAYRSFAQV